MTQEYKEVTETSALKESGILIRGADGRMYFVPESGLEAYALDDETAKQVTEELNLSGNVMAIRKRPGAVAGDEGKVLAAFVIFANAAALRRSSEIE